MTNTLFCIQLCYQTAQLAEFRSRNQFESNKQGTLFDMANSSPLLPPPPQKKKMLILIWQVKPHGLVVVGLYQSLSYLLLFGELLQAFIIFKILVPTLSLALVPLARFDRALKLLLCENTFPLHRSPTPAGLTTPRHTHVHCEWVGLVNILRHRCAKRGGKNPSDASLEILPLYSFEPVGVHCMGVAVGAVQTQTAGAMWRPA